MYITVIFQIGVCYFCVHEEDCRSFIKGLKRHRILQGSRKKMAVYLPNVQIYMLILAKLLELGWIHLPFKNS